MAYQKFYPSGWQSGPTGGTPISPEALQHIEDGLIQAYKDFAPSGFGLGEYVATILSDANAATKSGHYKMNSSTENGVGAGATLIVDGFAENYVTQTAIHIGTGRIQRRHLYPVDGVPTWQPWEWVVAPMNLGVEYRTPERWMNKPVYTTLANLGISKAGGIIVHTAIQATSIIKYCGYVAGFAIPSFYANSLTSEYSLTASVWVRNSTDGRFLSAYVTGNKYTSGSSETYNTYMQFWYTKD